MQVEDLMSAPVYTVSADDTVGHVKNVMLKRKVSRVLVTDGGALVGLIAKYDLAKMLESSEAGWRRRNQDRTHAKAIMSKDLITTSPNASIQEAAREIVANRIGCLPVLKEGELIGILTETDLAAYFATMDSKVRVKTIMSDSFLTCHRHHSINHVLREMEASHIFRTIVQEGNGVPVGIITHTDLTFAKEPFVSSKDIVMVRKSEHAGVQKNRYVRKVRQVAEDVMSEPLITVDSNARAVAAAQLMLSERLDAIPVVKGESVAGIISKTDLVKRLMAN
ncbi:MAG TPA: CBS domain-containing protein [Candidatus Bathyarchaeia archaeon]|nr:CBS domain-containing protein [Candidatus Bathyarchaeia archaeon]